MDKIYIVRGTEQAGPFTEAEIRAQLASGALTSDSMVWWEGLPEWTPISGTPLAAPSAPSGPLRVAPVQTPAPSAAVVDMGTKKTSGLAITSLVLGILSLPLTLCWIGVAFSVGGIVTGHLAYSKTSKDPSISGKGLALGGLICSYLGVVLFIAMLTFVVALGSQMKNVFATITSQIQAQQMSNNAPSTPETDTNSTDTNSAPTPAAPDSDTNSAPTNAAPVTPGQ